MVLGEMKQAVSSETDAILFSTLIVKRVAAVVEMRFSMFFFAFSMNT